MQNAVSESHMNYICHFGAMSMIHRHCINTTLNKLEKIFLNCVFMFFFFSSLTWKSDIRLFDCVCLTRNNVIKCHSHNNYFKNDFFTR